MPTSQEFKIIARHLVVLSAGEIRGETEAARAALPALPSAGSTPPRPASGSSGAQGWPSETQLIHEGHRLVALTVSVASAGQVEATCRDHQTFVKNPLRRR